ncbi:MAG: hypothetical protein IJB81_05225 [Clostridia bacterium]|nr:hypothetical protein [Clostridia bacterium]
MHTSTDSPNNVSRIIEEHLSVFDLFTHAYLFGSSLNPKTICNDIDLLVIYSKYSEEISSALKTISAKLERAIGLPVHLTALSEDEEQDTGFLARIKPNYMTLK